MKRRTRDESPVSAAPVSHGLTSYAERTRWPIQSLYFLLPFVIAYEGVSWVRHFRGQSPMVSIWAESMIEGLLSGSGVFAALLPPLVLVVSLIVWQQRRRDAWTPELKLYPLMLAEAVVLSLPIYVFSVVVFRGSPTMPQVAMPLNELLEMAPLLASSDGKPPLSNGLFLAIGAGIYEELLFRLLMIGGALWLLRELRLLKIRQRQWAAVLVSAVLFGLHHFSPDEAGQLLSLGGDAWGRMLFYTAAGVYLGVVMMLRGFGITAGTHTAYNVLVVLTADGVSG